jgi:hypothetical protein
MSTKRQEIIYAVCLWSAYTAALLITNHPAIDLQPFSLLSFARDLPLVVLVVLAISGPPTHKP